MVGIARLVEGRTADTDDFGLWTASQPRIGIDATQVEAAADITVSARRSGNAALGADGAAWTSKTKARSTGARPLARRARRSATTAGTEQQEKEKRQERARCVAAHT